MKRILITRPRSQANTFAQALRKAGFEPIFFPVIDIHPIAQNSALDGALGNLASYSWVIFTSVNGVEVVHSHLEKLYLKHLPEVTRVAAIGPKTAQALRKHKIKTDFIPNEYRLEAILSGLGDLKGRHVLLPRAEIARQALPEAIAQADGIAHEIAVYQTLPCQPDPTGLAAISAGVDLVTFTSPSTVHNFMTIIRQAGMNPYNLPGKPEIACIGPVTSEAATQNGLVVHLIAEEYTTEGLVKVIEKHLCH